MRYFLSIFFLLFATLVSASSDVILVVGTRPEAIKMVPVYQALKKEGISTFFCSTGQHAELLDSTLAIFGIQPDYDLKIMKPGQDLFYLTNGILKDMGQLFERMKPKLVVVQGDTTTAMSAAMAAFYLKIPVAHVEAGLRSGNIQSPFPEEMNRRLITVLTAYHFAPTQNAVANLVAEGIDSGRIFCTGNTVIDALHQIQDKICKGDLAPSSLIQEKIEQQRGLGHKIMLLTAHRRESFDGGLRNIFSAMQQALHKYPDLHVIYIKHPNPAIQKVLDEVKLGAEPNISIFSHLAYRDMVYLLSQVDFIATDSGGIQEEGSALNKPVLILRNETDRPEAIAAGGAKLVGTQREDVFQAVKFCMENKEDAPSNSSVYGDGAASAKIAQTIKKILQGDNR